MFEPIGRVLGGSPRPKLVPIASLVAMAFTVLLVACADAPSAPSAPAAVPTPSASASYATTTTTYSVNALLWTKPVSQSTVSKVIGPAGGSFSIANGIKVVVPPNAVSSNITFSVTRLPGVLVAYDFQPHGTVFAKPLIIQQPTLGTNLFKLDPAADIQGAYFPSSSLLNQTTGTAQVSEFEPTFVSADKAWITFTVQHFSGYIVASGRN